MPVKIVRDYTVFKTLVDGVKLVVSFFFVPWCPTCKRIAPIFRKLSNIYVNADFIKIDSSICPEVSEINEVMSHPTFVFFKSVRIDHLIGGDGCQLLKKIETLYGDDFINLDDTAALTQRDKTFEIEPAGNDDAVLGNNSYFLSRLKANCGGYKEEEVKVKPTKRKSAEKLYTRKSTTIKPILEDKGKESKDSKNAKKKSTIKLSTRKSTATIDSSSDKKKEVKLPKINEIVRKITKTPEEKQDDKQKIDAKDLELEKGKNDIPKSDSNRKPTVEKKEEVIVPKVSANVSEATSSKPAEEPIEIKPDETNTTKVAPIKQNTPEPRPPKLVPSDRKTAMAPNKVKPKEQPKAKGKRK